MPLTDIGSIGLAGGTLFSCAAMSGSSLFTVDSTNTFRVYSVTPNISLTSTPSTLTGSSPTGITLVKGSTAAICYSGTNQIILIDTNTLNSTVITTNAGNTPTAPYGNKIAALPALGIAASPRTSTVGLTITNANTNTCLVAAVTALNSANVVCARPDTNTFIVGGAPNSFSSSTATLVEVSTSGAILGSMALPFIQDGTLASAQLDSLFVTGITYYAPYVVALTFYGTGYLINWTTKTVVDMFYAGQQLVSNTGGTISNSVSGTCLLGTPVENTVNYAFPVSECYFEKGEFNYESLFFNVDGYPIAELGIEVQTGSFAYAIQRSPNTQAMKVYALTSPAKQTVQTGLQDPLGTFIAGRVIRIRDVGNPGNAIVEVDQAVSLGNSQVSCTTNRNYIELGLELSGTTPTKWDIREIQA